MTAPPPTFAQLKAQARSIREKLPNADVIAFRSPGQWTGETEQIEGELRYVVRQCDSPLSFRLALKEPAQLGMVRLLLTDLDEKQLGDEILLRVAKRRLISIERWDIVKSLFSAREVDPRLRRTPWITDELLEISSAGAFPPAAGGFLDEETVWRHILERRLNILSERPDLVTLLHWATDASNLVRVRGLSPTLFAGLQEWLGRSSSSTARLILDVAWNHEQPDAVPIGLVLGVLLDPRAAGQADRALGKLEERYLAGKDPGADEAARWHSAAQEVIRLDVVPARIRRGLLSRTDEILKEIQADQLAWLSHYSLIGFDHRMARFGDGIRDMLESSEPLANHLAAVQQRLEEVLLHAEAGKDSKRVDQAKMALRLLRWLVANDIAGPLEHTSFAAAAQYHLQEGGFVDWARLRLCGTEPQASLSNSYSKLVERVSRLRHQVAKTFATLLSGWLEAGSQSEGVLPIESVLEKVVAPAARSTPVLMIVVDGMSIAAFRELLQDLNRNNWIEITHPTLPSPSPVISALPSVTEVCRTSLLSGKLTRGDSADEQREFAREPSLVAAGRSNQPPILFHKSSLKNGDDSSLAPAVRKEILSSQRKVVGVVLNAIDDHLLKGDQLNVSWMLDQIHILPALLHEAKTAGRLVVLVSDHGHVLDRQTEGRLHEGGERWRVPDSDPMEDECLFQGPRVLLPAGGKVILPWSESVRYSMKKNGYHGGANPQEVVIPLAVLAPVERIPSEWQEVAQYAPGWWNFETGEDVTSPPQVPVAPTVPVSVESEVAFFGGSWSGVAEPRRTQSTTAGCPWIADLLSSPLFNEQKRYSGRTPLSDDLLINFLGYLAGRGGKATLSALGKAIGYPPLRLRGLIAVLQRLLNVDGYTILGRDEGADSVELNIPLLFQQFGLPEIQS